jgi:hypothetical protein
MFAYIGRSAWCCLGVAAFALLACGGSDEDKDGRGLTGGGAGKSTGGTGSGATGSGATGGSIVFPSTGGSAGQGNGSGGSSPSTGGSAGFHACTGTAYEQETTSSLDTYFVFDRTGSMGKDCSYTPNSTPPVKSKACYATYAMSDYLINVASSVDQRLAFQFMSQPNDCDGTPYETPLVGLTHLPIPADHQLIQAISNETFKGGLGTHIEGALRGIAAYTTAAKTAGREMIGVLMTDGDPEGCEQNIDKLAKLVSDHLSQDGIRTFIIGMQGATDANLEKLAVAGGADAHTTDCGSVSAPCHYWNVGEGDPDVISEALSAIVAQSAPIPCEFKVSGFTPPDGQTLDFGKVNVTLTDKAGTPTTIGQAAGEASCPTDAPAWYYDKPTAPTAIELCKNACDLVTDSASGSKVDVVVGCQDTVTLPPVK